MSTDETIGQARRIAELEELNRLAYALGASLSVEETLGAIADSCLHLTEGERVAILLFGLSPEQEAQTLIRRSDRGEADIDHVVNVLAADLIIRKAEPFTTEDILRSIQLAQPSSTAQRLGPALIYPLTAGERPFGIINLVNSKGGRPFTQEAVRVIGLVARLASQYIQRARLHEALFEDTQRLKEALRDRAGAGSLLGKSPPMKAAREKIALAAGSSATVLLIGETGTGKELAARALHFSGERAEKPFIAVNCAAIPTELFESELFGHEKGAYTGAGSGTRGKFELANNGTLFLDEISSMPPMLQPKLLRVIEEQAFYRIGSEVQTRVNVRIIAATSIDLERAVAEGHFRRELYHRLSVIPIELPPLRERTGDVPLLAGEFIREFSGGAKTFTAEALKLLCTLPWNGNVRELRNAVERASIFVSNPTITPADILALGIGSNRTASSQLRSELKRAVAGNRGTTNLLASIEKDLVQLAMELAKGNPSEAAAILGIDRHALRRRLEKYGESGSIS